MSVSGVRRRRWIAYAAVALCGVAAMGATIRKSSIIAGSTALIGGTASRVVVTDASGNITTSSILQHGTDVTLASGQVLAPNGAVTLPSYSFSAQAAMGMFRTSANILTFSANGEGLLSLLPGAVFLGSSYVLAWTDGTSYGGAQDLTLGRAAAANFRLGAAAANPPVAQTLSTQGASGTDIAGANFTIDVSPGTGTGAGGSFIVRTAPASTTGSAGNTLSAVWTVRPGDAHVAGAFHVQTVFNTNAHVVTVSNNGQGGVANGETLAGTRSLYFVDCLDGDGCPITLGESGVSVGSWVTIVSQALSTHAVSLADVSGVQHVASTFTMNPAASITFVYVINRSGDAYWVETARAAN